MQDVLPIIIISFNRGYYLASVVQAFLNQDIPLRIFIHDNGSDDPGTLDVLQRLERDGHAVRRRSKIRSPDDLNLVDETVSMALNGRNIPYGVTDCDIDLSIARTDALKLYLELLNLCGDVECVGPMLRISDIPKTYPLFGKVMDRHIGQFWREAPEWQATSKGEVAVFRCSIDTTLAVHRAGTPFRRLRTALRVYHPFEALHLDWYNSCDDITTYRVSSSPEISHWDNASATVEALGWPIPTTPYYTVEGRLNAQTVKMRYACANPAEVRHQRNRLAGSRQVAAGWRSMTRLISRRK